MRKTRWSALLAVALVGAACQDVTPPTSVRGPEQPVREIAPGTSQIASMYALDFVGTVATGFDMNDAGDVVGRHYLDPGCGPFCLPAQETVVWRGGTRITLPPGGTPLYLNNQGVIAGQAGTHAARWVPTATGYTFQDLGLFPGTSDASVGGIDDQGRIVGWATLGGAIPSIALPFMWSQGTGMVDLKLLGYPNERPAAISPGGQVVTWGYSYQLGTPASAVAMPPLPRGFVGAGSNGSAINDNGDQAHFLVSTVSQSLVYPFRLSRGGTWQQISSFGTGRLTSSGMGSINASQDITFTAQSSAFIAAGPAGVGQPLGTFLSPAYPGAMLSSAGAMNNAGQILASVYIGRSPRLVKMVPTTPCVGNCLVVSSFVMVGRFVQDPQFPGSCFAGGKMYNTTTTTLTVTDEAGRPMANAVVRGRYMDDYWTDQPVSGTTNANGVVAVTHKGLCGVGAIAFLVDGVTLGTRTLDRTRGTLANSVIPSVGPPPNQPPVARFTYSCNNGTRACSFNGTTSSDDVGVTSYRWTFGDGTTATGASPSHTYPALGTYNVTLTVTDGAGLTNATTKAITLSSATNLAPIAAWSATCLPAPAHKCTFDGRASMDPDGTIASYRWTRANGQPMSTLPVVTISFEVGGTRNFTLTVTDNKGKSASLTKSVVVP